MKKGQVLPPDLTKQPDAINSPLNLALEVLDFYLLNY